MKFTHDFMRFGVTSGTFLAFIKDDVITAYRNGDYICTIYVWSLRNDIRQIAEEEE
jgi:hypothetical protein